GADWLVAFCGAVVGPGCANAAVCVCAARGGPQGTAGFVDAAEVGGEDVPLRAVQRDALAVAVLVVHGGQALVPHCPDFVVSEVGDLPAGFAAFVVAGAGLPLPHPDRIRSGASAATFGA